MAKQLGHVLAGGNRPGGNLLRRVAALDGHGYTLSPGDARPLPRMQKPAPMTTRAGDVHRTCV
jgi:hypothetical protein